MPSRASAYRSVPRGTICQDLQGGETVGTASEDVARNNSPMEHDFHKLSFLTVVCRTCQLMLRHSASQLAVGACCGRERRASLMDERTSFDLHLAECTA